MPASSREVDGYAVAADVDVWMGCAALAGCGWDCDVGGELVWAALAVAGGVLMPFVSGAGDAMVVGVVVRVVGEWCM